MIQQISVTHDNITEDQRVQESRRRKAIRIARARREKVARQRRTLLFTAIAMVLGVILTFSVLGTSAQATGMDQASDSYKYYKEVYVESGDTLWTIAEAYTDGSVSEIRDCIAEVRNINGLSKYETLKSGTYITVPYYSAHYLH